MLQRSVTAMPSRRVSLPSLPRGMAYLAAATAVLGFLASLLGAAFLQPATPAQLAAPLVFVAVLWLVPYSAALIRGEAWALILYLAFLLFVTDSNFRTRPWNDGTLDWQVMLKGMSWLAAGVIGAIHLGSTGRLLTRPPVLTAGLLMLLFMASTLYSPIPGYTAMAAGAFFCLFLFGLALVEKLTERQILIGMTLGLGLIVWLSLAILPFGMMSFAEVGKQSTGEAFRMRGMTDHPVGLAMDSALYILMAGALMTYGRWRVLLFLTILGAALALILSASRMPALALLSAWAIAYICHKRMFGIFLPLVLLLIVGATMAEMLIGFDKVIPEEVLQMTSRSGDAREVLTLTGRLDIWDFVLSRVARAPFLGHGFSSAREVLFKDFRGWALVHAHNSFLQVLLYTGWIGGITLLATFAAQIRIFWRQPSMFRDTAMLFLILSGITEPAMISNLPNAAGMTWMITLGLAAAALRPGEAKDAAPISGIYRGRAKELTPAR